MKIPALVCLGLAAAVPAQSFLALPATASPQFELGSFTLLPFMQPNARVQTFYDATEVGSSAFTADQVALCYDGPIPQVGAPGPFSVQRLQIRIGTSTVAFPSSRFDDNLTSTLTTVFDGPWTYRPDNGSAAPHPWGGPNGTLTFPFSAPATITIPPGGWLVVEMVMQGNNIQNFGFAHAILDGATTSGGAADGSTVAFGQGCAVAPGAQPATIGSVGPRAPGAAHWVTGQNLGANAPVFAIYGFSDTTSALGPLPWTLPGGSCQLRTSIELTSLLFADANGEIPDYTPGAALAIPADNAFAGLVLFEQLGAYAPGTNVYGLALSSAQRVTLGTLNPLGRGTYSVWHDTDAGSPLANDVRPFGYAMRLRTL